MAQFNLLNILRKPSLLDVRKDRIKREGSPYYSWIPAAIAAGGSISIHVPSQFPESKKYSPLDWIEVVNMEVTNNLTLVINGNDAFPIPASIIRTIKNQALWHLTLTNNGGAITTLNKIILTLQKQPQNIDDWARNR